MNMFRCRNFMCVWVSMCLCLWWFVWACSTVCLFVFCLCLFWSLLFIELLEILFVHAFILSEKRSEPVRSHWESTQGLPIIILRPHRWLPPQQMTSAAEESSCLPIDTFNHRSLTEGPSFQNIWPTGNFWWTFLYISDNIYFDICLTTFPFVTGQETQDKLFVMQV